MDLLTLFAFTVAYVVAVLVPGPGVVTSDTVFLTATGRSFCSGGDFKMLRDGCDPWPVHRRFRNLSRWLIPLISLDKPVVVGPRGYHDPDIRFGSPVALRGPKQWQPVNQKPEDMAPGAHSPDRRVPTMMTTADMALREDPEFRVISEKSRPSAAQCFCSTALLWSNSSIVPVKFVYRAFCAAISSR